MYCSGWIMKYLQPAAIPFIISPVKSCLFGGNKTHHLSVKHRGGLTADDGDLLFFSKTSQPKSGLENQTRTTIGHRRVHHHVHSSGVNELDWQKLPAARANFRLGLWTNFIFNVHRFSLFFFFFLIQGLFLFFKSISKVFCSSSVFFISTLTDKKRKICIFNEIFIHL